jgi:four helix bundle protein
MGFAFENLEVYKKAVYFANKTYKTTRGFPKNEIYGLTSQIRRAAVSISTNIAEGSGRYHKKDFAQFLRISRSSVYECVPLFEIARHEDYINAGMYNELLNDCNELAKMINGLIKSLRTQ